MQKFGSRFRRFKKAVPQFVLSAAWTIGIAFLGCPMASAAEYPDRPVKIIVPNSVGGSTDNVWRIVAPKLAEELGQAVVIENKVGAGGTIGMAYALTLPPDGYTLVGASNMVTAGSALYKNLRYDAVKDFETIGQIAESSTVLVVNPVLPVRSVAELIALAKSKPGTIDYSSAGVGTGQHMFMELFTSMANISMNHIPYKQAGETMTDLLAGRVPVTFVASSIALRHLKSQRIVPLAVSGAKRSSFLPDIPTLEESGVHGYAATLRDGLQVKAGTPASIRDKLEKALQKVMQQPEVKSAILAVGSEPVFMSSVKYSARIAEESEIWRRLIEQRRIKVD